MAETGVITTTAGRISGLAHGGVTGFLGVPYAAPPVGQARMSLPGRHPGWDGVRRCTERGAAAPQVIDLSTPFGVATQVGRQSEDCLWLSVWTPAPDPSARLPILVWLHGGAFVSGTAGDLAYDGARLAADGVVVVAVNTRLGALGMLDLREVVPGGTCNLTLRDQAAALDWVRENASSLGGDPDLMTVAGESVGGTSAMAHLSAAVGPSVRRAIVQSGSTNQFMTADASGAVARAVLSRAGVRVGDLEGLRAIPVARIVTAQQQVLGDVWLGSPQAVEAFGDDVVSQLTPYLPTQDDHFVPTSLLDGLARGTGPIDMLIGTTRDEAAIYRFAAGAIDGEWALSNLDRAISHGRTRLDRARLLDWYETSEGIDLEAIETDRYFRAPTLEAADVVAARDDSTVFTYRIDLSGGSAAHMIDVPATFGTTESPLGRWFSSTLDAEDELYQLSHVVRRTWAGFCRDGGVTGSLQHTSGSRSSNIFSADGVVAGPCDGRVRGAWRTPST